MVRSAPSTIGPAVTDVLYLLAQATEPGVPVWLQAAAVVTPILVALAGGIVWLDRRQTEKVERNIGIDTVRALVDERHNTWDTAASKIDHIAEIAEENRHQVRHVVTTVDALKDQLVDNGNNVRAAVQEVDERLGRMEERGNQRHNRLNNDIRALQRAVHGSERRIKQSQHGHRDPEEGGFAGETYEPYNGS